MRLPESGNVRQPSFLAAHFDLFATEGGTAAMCYIFDSLQREFPTGQRRRYRPHGSAFTPYIEIPQLDGLPVQGDRTAYQPHEQRRAASVAIQ